MTEAHYVLVFTGTARREHEKDTNSRSTASKGAAVHHHRRPLAAAARQRPAGARAGRSTTRSNSLRARTSDAVEN
jgi:hypothetical protein